MILAWGSNSMFHGVLALVGRSLRMDARSWAQHLSRLALVVSIYFALAVTLWTSSFFGAPGLRFFYGIAYLNLAFITLLGISFFSTPISEEKEEDALGLMMMAGVSPLGILVGKSGGRMIQAFLLIAVQYPFTLLAVTMGGVTSTQVSAAYAGLTAYMVLLAGFGLLCSTVGGSSRRSATLMSVGVSAYVLIPFLLWSFLTWLRRIGLTFPIGWLHTVFDRVIETSVFQMMGTILTSGFGDPRFSWQVVSNLAMGAGSFLLAWLLFGVTSRQPAAEPISRGLVSRSRRGQFQVFAPGRPWGNPFVWKDFYFVSGGYGMIFLRLAFCVGLFVIAALQQHGVVSFYQVFLSLAVAIDAGRMLAGAIRDEVRGQTLASLMMLPRTAVFIMYSKFAGALLGWVPGLAVDVFFCLFTREGARNFEWLFRDPLGFCVLSYFVLIPNLAALLALYLRWGAVALSVAVAIGIHVLVVAGWRPNTPFFSVAGIAIFAICMVCHVIVIRQIRSLAASS